MSVFFISGRTKDSVHLIHDNFRYGKDRCRNGTIYWRCMMSRRTSTNPITCKARITTDRKGNVLQFPNHNHNHPPNEADIHIRKCISDIKLSARRSTHSRQTIDKILSDVPDFVKPLLPSDKALKKCLQRSRTGETSGIAELYSMLDRPSGPYAWGSNSDLGNLTHLLEKKPDPVDPMEIKIESHGPTFSLAGLQIKQNSLQPDAQAHLLSILLLQQLQLQNTAWSPGLPSSSAGSSPISCRSETTPSPPVNPEPIKAIKEEAMETNDSPPARYIPTKYDANDEEVLKLLSIHPSVLQGLLQMDSTISSSILNTILKSEQKITIP